MVAILYDETPNTNRISSSLRKSIILMVLFPPRDQGVHDPGGDPTPDVKTRWTPRNGGPGYSIPAEINPKFFHEKGALSAARLSDDLSTKSSSGSQF